MSTEEATTAVQTAIETPAAEAKTDSVDNAALCKQIEFYFSTANLVRDQWLQGLIAAGDAGYVPLTEFLNCARVKKFTTSAEVLADAISGSTFLSLDETKTHVRRSVALDESYDPLGVTVYVKPWPTDMDVDATAKAFAPYGDVAAVWNRTFKPTPDAPRVRKPSVFVEFANADSAKRAVEAATKDDCESGGLSPHGERLTVLLKKDYLNQKKAEKTGRKGAKGGDDSVAKAIAERQEVRAGKKRARDEDGSDSDAEDEGPLAAKRALVEAGVVYRIQGDKVVAGVTWQEIKEAFGGKAAPIVFVRIEGEKTETKAEAETETKAEAETEAAPAAAPVVHVIFKGGDAAEEVETAIKAIAEGFTAAVEADDATAAAVKADANRDLIAAAAKGKNKAGGGRGGRGGGRGFGRGRGGRGGRGSRGRGGPGGAKRPRN